MINMENREIEKFEQAYNYWITDKLDDGTFSTLVYNFISKHKNTLDEIERLKSELKERTSLAMDYVNQIYQLQFELKAADSVNEQLQFQYNELEKAMYKLTISNDNN